jgi:O-antigen/teichoic acid export membrane protein
LAEEGSIGGPEPLVAGGVLRRALANTGILLSGKTFAALMQLVTFALAARGLGIQEFGYFSMLVAQVMLITGIADFESNQAVVRFGVDHLATGNARGFQALIKAGTLLDLGAGAVATLVAILVPPLLGPAIGWSERIIWDAQLIAPLAFATATATPKGMLRLFNRFDLLTIQAVVTPAARLAGFTVAWMTGAGLAVYLLLWLIAGWLGAAAAYWLSWREARRRDLLRGITSSMRKLASENAGVWRFTFYTNLHSSVSLIPSQGATYIVGALMGPEAAGLFKIARELGAGMARPIQLVNHALFPDIARLVRGKEWRRLMRTAVRAGLIAGGTGFAITLIALLIGRQLIGLLFGLEFQAAAPLLVVISLAMSLRVFAFAADPILYALHKPEVALVIAVAACVIFLAALVAWAEKGPAAAGLAFLIMNGVAALLSAAAAYLFIRQAASPAPRTA